MTSPGSGEGRGSRFKPIFSWTGREISEGGGAFYFEPTYRNTDIAILQRAHFLAFDSGGGTMPIDHYYIDMAREQVTGEVNEIAKLRKENAVLRAEITALKATGKATP